MSPAYYSCFLNSLVHVVMYTYYLLAALLGKESKVMHLSISAEQRSNPPSPGPSNILVRPLIVYHTARRPAGSICGGGSISPCSRWGSL